MNLPASAHANVHRSVLKNRNRNVEPGKHIKDPKDAKLQNKENKMPGWQETSIKENKRLDTRLENMTRRIREKLRIYSGVETVHNFLIY